MEFAYLEHTVMWIIVLLVWGLFALAVLIAVQSLRRMAAAHERIAQGLGDLQRTLQARDGTPRV
ncbi:MAG TPA: hypothetical protein VFK13_07375 [Gemmatimonadaceae bacterium]|nr:hypothetical protein [Gemmatimonadaceae bacterium]